MVAQEDGPLAVVGDLRRLGQDLGDREALLATHRHEQPRHQREVEAHVTLVAVAEVVDEVRRPLVGLGQQHPVRMGRVDLLAQLAQQRVGLGQVLARAPVALEQVGHGIESEPVEPEVEPEAHDAEHRLDHGGVLVVEVGLMRIETVPVVLLAGLIPRPVRRLDVDEDHARLGPALVVVVPDVPVRLGIVTRRARLDEPRVLVARVVHHQIGDDADAAPVSVVEELDEVVEEPEVGVHGEEVTDVVPAVAHGRGVERQQPQAVDAEPLQIVELGPQPREVADAVVVGVEEAAGEHFVEHTPPVPVGPSLGGERGGADAREPGASGAAGRGGRAGGAADTR